MRPFDTPLRPRPQPRAIKEADKPDAKTGTLPKSRLNHKVVLFNDELHTYDYVVEMLTHTCRLGKEAAFRCAVEVDLTGRTIVFYGSREEAELVCEKIRTYGPDHRIPESLGSMESQVQ